MLHNLLIINDYYQKGGTLGGYIKGMQEKAKSIN
jgi:hypothetical protein